MLPDRLFNAGRKAVKAPSLSARSNIRRTPQSSTLPAQLQKVVPSCAQQCLAAYIAQEYSNCPHNDLTCLCREYSSEGYALGELAYICLHQNCGTTSASQSSAQFYVCTAQTGAVPATHSVLTIPPTTTSRPLQSSSSTDDTVPIVWTPTSQFNPTSHPNTVHATTQPRATVTSSPTHSSVPGAHASSISRSSIVSSSASAAAASTSTSASASTSSGTAGLSVGGAVGISLAALVVVGLTVAIAYFLTCFRRRKSKYQDEKSSYDFVDDTPTGAGMREAGPKSKKFKPENQQYQSPHDLFQHWPNQNNDNSPESQASYESLRSVSNLLPNKPNPTQQPRQPPKIMLRQPSSDTTATVFAADQATRVPSMNIFAAGQAPRLPTPNFPSPRFPSPKFPGMATGLPSHPRVADNSPVRKPQPAQLTTSNVGLPSDPRHPPLQLEIPPQARSPVLPPPAVYAGLPYPRDRQIQPQQPVRSEPMTMTHSNESSENDVLDYYASPDAGTMPEFHPPTPIQVEIQKRKAAPKPITVTKPIYPPIAVRKDSAGSDTSFESGDEDEPTPPEEEKPLTPVEEDPITLESPISGIRYPKIPRSANQNVARSPRQTLSPRDARRAEDVQKAGPRTQRTIRVVQNAARPPFERTNTSNSLLAKRRGDNAVYELELDLHKPGTPHAKTTDSPHQLPSKVQSERPGRSPRRDQRAPNGPREPRYDALKGDGRTVNRNPSFSQPGYNGRYPAPLVSRKAGQPPIRQVQVEEPLKSPMWEPKLTPSRRGEDLYLSVGVATPTTTQFTPMNPNFYR